MNLAKILSPLLLFFALSPNLQAQDFKADKNCLAYHVEKTMFMFKDVTVWGTSCEVTAKVTKQAGGVVATVEVPFNSMDSTEAERDETLQQSHFFTEKYPTVSFTSAAITKTQLMDLKMGKEINFKGNVTIMALTSELVFTMKLEKGHLLGKASDSIKRLGVKAPKIMGGMMVKVHDPLEITFDFLVTEVPGAMAALR